MPREWYVNCKDCGQEFGYSDDSYRLSKRRGLSRPERCPQCRKMHSREIGSLGLSHFDLTPVSGIPFSGLSAGRLGGLVRPTRVHDSRERNGGYDLTRFGIKDEHILEFIELMGEKQVMVIVAPTGAGKSTFLPYRLMVPPKPLPNDLFARNGQIVITQPRIQATRNIPLFVARELHGSNLGAGFDVGFRHHGSPSTDWRNKLVYMTDGSLINLIVRNELSNLSVVMIDEAHERSLNIDLILGLLKAQLPRYPHLKLIIASATINAGMFLEYYGGPKEFDPDIFSVDGGEGFLTYDNNAIATALKDSQVGFYGFPGKRQYPVETRFRVEDPVSETHWSGRMADELAKKVIDILHAMAEGKETVHGDVLGFLHGEAPIEKAVELIQAGVEEDPLLAGKVDVLALYTKLPQSRQDQALLPKKDSNRRRVVISTNVAETSLTVDGIVHVVDSGLINESQWDTKTQTSFVMPKIHSQAGCKQRWGRAGRIQAGIAHCLYTAEQFENFPKYTDPEIQRAPLDQIVLTAKTAGVDNIQTFDWIQAPSKEELDRAPHYLQQIGALDEFGDLTEHGLELSGFAEEIDIANLMILADRFGCAVEMATLLPIRKLGGFKSLLLWDKGWDAATKRAVHRIHQGLTGPCVDDIEFALKIWEAWEGKRFGRSPEARRSWSRHYFVNHSLLGDKILQEREALLEGLSGHKKEQNFRSVNFDLLTRLRILILYGLPNMIYLLEEGSKDGLELNQSPIFKPYIPDHKDFREIISFHADATVEINPQSICAGKAPQAFVCGLRQRVRRRMSPLSEPLNIITANFLSLIKPEWTRFCGESIISLARLLAVETRNNEGDLITSTTRSRLFIDQKYPVGSVLECMHAEVDQKVIIKNLVEPAKTIIPRRNNEDIDGSNDIEILEAEKPLASTGIRKEDKKFVVDETEESLNQLYWLEIAEVDEDIKIDKQTEHLNIIDLENDYGGRLVHPPIKVSPEKSFSAIVIGYDLSTSNMPEILLEVQLHPDPFDQFSTLYKMGDRITGKVTSIEHYLNDWMTYLVIREEKTGLEVILDPYDASIIGRNFVIEMLDIGEEIETTIEEIDQEARRVRVTCLQQSEAALLNFIGRGEERNLDAIITEVRDNGLYLWIDPENTNRQLPISAFVYINRLPQRPDEMFLGQACKVYTRPQTFLRELRRSLIGINQSELEAIGTYLWDDRLKLDEENLSIIATRRITYEQRLELLALSKDPIFQRAVNILFRRTNEVDVRVIDITGLEQLANLQTKQFRRDGRCQRF
jgi:hypothetical protein